MYRGYIKLWRKAFDTGMHRNHKLWALWTWILGNVTHKEIKYMAGNQALTLKPGQIVTGRRRLAEELAMSERNIRTCLLQLEKLENLTIKTTNRYSLLTVVNWGFYQSHDEKTTSKTTKNRPASDQQVTTKQECKNKRSIQTCPFDEIVARYNQILGSDLPTVTKLSEDRKRAVNARWNECYKAQNGLYSNSIEFWDSLFKYILKSDFLMGRIKPWRANFDFIVKRKNFYKIVEGTYEK
jgi:hypothetical protein